MAHPDPKRISATVLAIFRTYGHMLAWGDRFVAPLGTTSARWQMLGALAMSEQPLTAPRIADAMGVTRQGAHKQIKLLMADGLVEQLPNPAHRRSPLYRFTTRGRKLFGEIDARWTTHAREVARAFTVAELDTTLRVLQTLSERHALAAEENADEA